MLHSSDALARPHKTELKRRFGDHEVLQYLLIDGQLDGAVIGHWRIGPYDVDDIVVELPQRDRDSRRDEIIQAVRQGLAPPRHNIRKYAGKSLR